MRDLKKSENMIKYKGEIESRPQKQWFMGQSKKDNIKQESIEDLKNIKNKFEEHTKNENQLVKKKEKRKEQRVKEKAKKKGGSNFKEDADKSATGKGSGKKKDDAPKIFRKKKDLFKKKGKK